LTALCVFCGSSPGSQPAFSEATAALGKALVARDIDLVYGGATVGLMGVLANTVMAAGGHATGIITESLAGHEIANHTLSQLEVVPTMHDRKARMAELADGFVMLPGGFGTFEEFMESVTWAQLGIHNKPCGILNVEGYFNSLLTFFDHAVTMGFIKTEPMHRISVDEDVKTLLDDMGLVATL
jgi:hypothetical protein